MLCMGLPCALYRNLLLRLYFTALQLDSYISHVINEMTHLVTIRVSYQLIIAILVAGRPFRFGNVSWSNQAQVLAAHQEDDT